MSQAVTRTIVKINGFSLHRPRLLPVLCVLVLVALLSLVFVWSRIHAINLEYSVSRLQQEIHQHQQLNRELKLEAAFLARDERIERLARRHLGLRSPAPGQIIRIE